MPGYAQIGAAASFILLLVRVAQGFAHGGENQVAYQEHYTEARQQQHGICTPAHYGGEAGFGYAQAEGGEHGEEADAP